MKKISFVLIVFVLTASGLRAQSKDSAESKKIDTSGFRPIFTSVVIEPSFPGGVIGWTKFIERNLNSSLGDLYIPIPKGQTSEKQTVNISFTVNEDGTLSDFAVTNVVHPKLAEEVIRLFKKSPKWKPAIQNGHTVTYRSSQAITFVATKD